MREDLATRASYLISGFWLGFLTNLVLAILIISFFNWLFKLAGINFNLSLVALIFFSLAFIFSLYGSWNAFQPRLKNITVTIPNLPENWQDKKIVQLSDVHLGLIYRKDFLQNIIDQINPLNPELVLITGDFFDGMDGKLDLLISPLNNLKTAQGTFFVNGNHETYLGTEKTIATLEKNKVQILKDQVVDISGLKLIGIGYPERDLKKDIIITLQELKPQFFGKPNILLYHSPTNIQQFAENGVNLQLSGHTHLGQIFPFNFITKLIYHGYDYGLHTINNYTIYISSGLGTWGPAMRTNSTPEIVVITLKNKTN
jgi:predicted MPP superfamily phosphohydrolase